MLNVSVTRYDKGQKQINFKSIVMTQCLTVNLKQILENVRYQ